MVFLMVQRFMKLQRKYRHIDGNDYFPLVVKKILKICKPCIACFALLTKFGNFNIPLHG